MHPAVRLEGPSGKKLRMPVSSICTTSPGSTSRSIVAPRCSSAHVSEAAIHPSPSRPRQSGRTPSGSRTANSVSGVMIVSEYAPLTRRIT